MAAVHSIACLMPSRWTRALSLPRPQAAVRRNLHEKVRGNEDALSRLQRHQKHAQRLRSGLLEAYEKRIAKKVSSVGSEEARLHAGLRPPLKLHERFSRMRCVPAHLMRYVVSEIMWRRVCKSRVSNENA